MEQLGKPKLLGLLAFLGITLIFVGTNLLYAQVKAARKGPKPRQGLSWTVHIPGAGSLNNLYGFFPGTSNVYDDTGQEGDGILIDVLTGQGGTEATTRLRLAVGNNIDGSGNCTDDWSDGLGIRKIGFQNMTIGDEQGIDYWYSETIADEYPCFFPTSSPTICECPSCGMGSVPGCMATFLNNLHPYAAGPGCTHPECCYYLVEIKAEFNRLIGDIVGEQEVTGFVWINLHNTDDLQSGCEYPHNIEGYCSFEIPSANYKIEKTGENTWTVSVEGTFTFAETYRGIKEGKGKGGKATWEYKTPYWALIPLKFEMDWSRVE